MIQQTLKDLGLKDKEIAVYLKVLELGKTTHAQISRITGINRATVYSVASLLIDKGLLQEDLGGSIKYIYALPPEDLDVLIKREKRELSKKEKLVEKAVQELKDLPLNTQYAVPHVRFLDEENLDHELKSNVTKWEESMRKSDPTFTWWGFQDHTFAEHFEGWIKWYWQRAPKDIELKLLSNNSSIEKELGEKNLECRQIKTLASDSCFTATTWVLGEYLLMIYTNEHPFYAIEIHNPVLAHNYRELFRTFWEKY